jgi:hypothetical protein
VGNAHPTRWKSFGLSGAIRRAWHLWIWSRRCRGGGRYLLLQAEHWAMPGPRQGASLLRRSASLLAQSASLLAQSASLSAQSASLFAQSASFLPWQGPILRLRENFSALPLSRLVPASKKKLSPDDKTGTDPVLIFTPCVGGIHFAWASAGRCCFSSQLKRAGSR